MVILAEECAEVQQETSKVLRFGVHNFAPGAVRTPSEENAHRLMSEYYQMQAVMDMLVENGVLEYFSEEEKNQVIADKKTKVERSIELSIARRRVKEYA